MPKLLDVRDLHVTFKTYLGALYAVRGVNFHVNQGEAIAIVGESGCGKSVSTKAIMQLIPSPPGRIEKGEIFFQGKDLLKKKPSELKNIRGKDIGIIFQDPMTSLNPTMKIGKQIMEGILLHEKTTREKARNAAIEMLELVGMPNPKKRFEQYPHEFSGGMCQRVMIAIALACKPKLLLADEPTTALDVTIQAQILELMQDIQKKTGTSIILITHDLGIVAKMCQRIVVMYAGKVVETGSSHDIFYSPQHPYTQGLLRSTPKITNKKEKLIPILGSPPNQYSIPAGCAFCGRCKHAMKICNMEQPPDFQISQTQKTACWQKYDQSNT
jgi:oligopeptide transport system ATP-binding protein